MLAASLTVNHITTGVLVFKSIRGVAPTYLSDHCKPTLVATNLGQLSVSRTRTTNGDRSFGWNSLPPALRSRDTSTRTFTRQLTNISV